MEGNPLVGEIVRDEALTRGLGDAEARMLVEWLVDHADLWIDAWGSPRGEREGRVLWRRARTIARFVLLWAIDRNWGAAAQLAAVERFGWPLPQPEVDPCELMQVILNWEGQNEVHRLSG